MIRQFVFATATALVATEVHPDSGAAPVDETANDDVALATVLP